MVDFWWTGISREGWTEVGTAFGWAAVTLPALLFVALVIAPAIAKAVQRQIRKG